MTGALINGKQCTILWHVDDLKLLHGDLREDYDQCAGNHQQVLWKGVAHHGHMRKGA
jgi:hypothetical protein